MQKDFHTRRKSYIDNHSKRYDYCIGMIKRHTKWEKSNIIDVGSKYLYQAEMLSDEKNEIYCYDTSEVVNKQGIKQIAKENDIHLKPIGSLETGRVADEQPSNKFDTLIMTEVLEHLAFNPIPMWRSLFRVLKPGAKVFISTPNSIELRKRVVDIARIITGEGKGVTVSSIMETPTYGHHWKEYSIREIKTYFNRIGINNQDIKITSFAYRSYEWERARDIVYNVLRWIGRCTKQMNEQIFLRAQIPSPKPSLPDVDSYI